jgi:hypothetical protein
MEKGKGTENAVNNSVSFPRPLTFGISRNSLDRVSATRGADTPLHIAVNLGNVEAVRALLASEPKVNVNATMANGCTPLHILRREDTKDEVEIVNLLIKHGADVNAGREWDNSTKLHDAASSGLINILNALLMAPGINVNAKTKYGDTPLTYAARNGHIECVRALMAAHGIDPQAHPTINQTLEDKNSVRSQIQLAAAQTSNVTIPRPTADVITYTW